MKMTIIDSDDNRIELDIIPMHDPLPHELVSIYGGVVLGEVYPTFYGSCLVVCVREDGKIACTSSMAAYHYLYNKYKEEMT